MRGVGTHIEARFRYSILEQTTSPNKFSHMDCIYQNFEVFNLDVFKHYATIDFDANTQKIFGLQNVLHGQVPLPKRARCPVNKSMALLYIKRFEILQSQREADTACYCMTRGFNVLHFLCIVFSIQCVEVFFHQHVTVRLVVIYSKILDALIDPVFRAPI